MTVYGDGSQTRSFQFVDDLVEGIVRLMGVDYHGPVNLGNPDEYTVRQFAEVIRELVPGAGPLEFGRFRRTIPDSASPTSRWPRRFSAGSPRCRCAPAFSRRSTTSAVGCNAPRVTSTRRAETPQSR